jgi:hypothetical protein
MVPPKKSAEIGLRKARALCNMSVADRMAFVAEGLPILFESAQSLARASEALTGRSRESEILDHHSQEECAKALILVDLMRCPANLMAARTGPMIQWFYDHLARLIYAEAQGWRPVTAADLQTYIDRERKSHYLEGEYGEYILPNSTLFRRESVMYADVAADDDGTLQWLAPEGMSSGFGYLKPMAFQIADALSALGVFTLAGVKILHDVWGATPITPATRWEITFENHKPLLEALQRASLCTDRASQDHVNTIANFWQMPMYGMDFREIEVPLEELWAAQDAQYPY